MGLKIINKSGKDFIAQKKAEMLAEIEKRKTIRSKKTKSILLNILFMFLLLSGLGLFYILIFMFTYSNETENDNKEVKVNKTISLSFKEDVSKVFNLKGSSFQERENFYAISPLILKEVKHDNIKYNLDKNSFILAKYETSCLDEGASLEKGCNFTINYTYNSNNELLSNNRYNELYTYKLNPLEDDRISVTSFSEKTGGGVVQFINDENGYQRMFSDIFSFLLEEDEDELKEKLLKIKNYIQSYSLKKTKNDSLIKDLNGKIKETSLILRENNSSLDIDSSISNELDNTFDLSSLDVNDKNEFIAVFPFILNKKISAEISYRFYSNDILKVNYRTDCLPINYSGSNKGQPELLRKILSTGCKIEVSQDFVKNIKKNIYENEGRKYFVYNLNFKNTGKVENNKIIVNLKKSKEGNTSYFNDINIYNDFLNRLYSYSNDNKIDLEKDIKMYKEYFKK